VSSRTSSLQHGQHWLMVRRDSSTSTEPGSHSLVLGFTVTGGKIVQIDMLADPERLRHLNLAALDD